MLIAVLKIRQVQGSMFLALCHLFSPPHVVDSLAFNYEEIGVPTDAVLAFNLETQCCIKRHAPVPRFLSDPSQQANELEKSDIGGIAVHIAARIVSQAAGECPRFENCQGPRRRRELELCGSRKSALERSSGTSERFAASQ
jgi:hypothetical protein